MFQTFTLENGDLLMDIISEIEMQISMALPEDQAIKFWYKREFFPPWVEEGTDLITQRLTYAQICNSVRDGQLVFQKVNISS